MNKRKHPTKQPAWRGDETRPGLQGSETPEDAARRAEGNAPIRVDEAVRTAEEDDHPTLPILSSTPGREGDEESDGEENSEEKRIAAAEEHAEQPRHGLHGKL
jgi:hypothetical protein